MYPLPQQGDRDARVQTLDTSPPRDFQAPPIDPRRPGSYQLGAAQRLGSAVRADPEREAAAPPPRLLRVQETISVYAKAPDGHGHNAKLRRGKILSSAHYDFDHLVANGVKLAPIDQDLVAINGAPQSAALQLADVLKALNDLGLEVRPRADAEDRAMRPKATDDAAAKALAEKEAEIAKLREQLAAKESAPTPPERKQRG